MILTLIRELQIVYWERTILLSFGVFIFALVAVFGASFNAFEWDVE